MVGVLLQFRVEKEIAEKLQRIKLQQENFYGTAYYSDAEFYRRFITKAVEDFGK